MKLFISNLDLVCDFSYIMTNSKSISIKNIFVKIILATSEFKIWNFKLWTTLQALKRNPNVHNIFFP